ncbi:MAG: GNAT family N-acetyltransferase, partial [Spirochaetaceae bacterium]|nr:GNAT family N-acetyltransferase [Spirochaetaceae bacterium]
WDALVGDRGFPLMSWGFLALLEESGSVRAGNGWSPAHLLAREGGRLVAAAPFYVKSHSWGEFVFDFEFAEAARRGGKSWYPKLVGMVPLTPAPAWRVATAAGRDADALARIALGAASKAAREAALAGLHVLWPDLAEGERARPRGASTWEHQAFLWTDRGWGRFEDMLGSFSKNMRRNVRREREAVRQAGIETRVLRAGEAAAVPGLLALMADLYESHNDKFGPWAAKFLERDFFLRLPEFMPEGWAIAAGFEGRGPALPPEPVALAFLLEGKDRLYGRYWGALRDVDCLHFELCYYMPIEYALERGIRDFDPGMGSPHKARRGFRSLLAPSYHAPFDRGMSTLMDRALSAINAEEAAAAAALDGELPYKASSVR